MKEIHKIHEEFQIISLRLHTSKASAFIYFSYKYIVT
jgi:hypothetical protein